MSFLSGSFNDCIAFRTVSQWPLFISATNPSTLSTVFSDTPVSSCIQNTLAREQRESRRQRRITCKICSVFTRFASLRYCCINRITLENNEIILHDIQFIFIDNFSIKTNNFTHSADSISIDISRYLAIQTRKTNTSMVMKGYVLNSLRYPETRLIARPHRS